MTKRSPWLALAGILLLTVVAAACGFLLQRGMRNHLQDTRAVAMGDPPAVMPIRSSGSPYGVNVQLAAAPADLEASLDLAQQGGYLWLRQHFPWSEIEPQPGVYTWAAYDRIVDATTKRGLKLIAVLNTSPAWSRASKLATSPPDNMEDYANFVAAFVERYRGRIDYIQIWDEPNVAPNWGEWWASPDEYVGMLKAAYPRAKAANPDVKVLAGGLAPTVADDQWNLNDVSFLRRMYAKGAKGSFDILAAKPYGFWTGPDDRRVAPSILNFSRAILLRDIMEKNGDGALPVWAVEMGWNALPPDWQGKPSLWGSDTEDVQARRTVDAVQRAQAEWPWMDVMAINGLRFPAAAADDPVHGFALVDMSLKPRLAYTEVLSLAQRPLVAGPGKYDAGTNAAVYSAGWTAVDVSGEGLSGRQTETPGAEVTLRFSGTSLVLYAQAQPGGARLLVWVDGQSLDRLPRNASGTSFVDLGSPTNKGMVATTLADTLDDGEHTLRMQVSEWLGGSQATIGGYEVVRFVTFWPLYGLLALLAAGLAACVAGIAVLMPRLPWQAWDALVDRLALAALLAVMAATLFAYYLAPWLPLAALAALAFGALAIARLDLALLLTVLTFPFYLYPRHVGGQVFSLPEVLTVLCFGAWLARGLGQRQWRVDGAFRWPAFFFLAVAAASLGASSDLRLSVRELRMVVIEPVMFYIMAVAAFDRRERSLPVSALVWALVLSGTLAAGQSLVQYASGHVITAEGVRRALGPYGSPNNLGLLLERVLPLALALAIWGRRNAETRGRGWLSPGSLLSAACSLLIVLALFLTYSVGAWLGAAVGLLVFAALRGKKQLLALAAALALLALVLLPLLRVDRVVSHLGLQGATTSIRLDVWRSSLDMLRDQLLRGVGLDGFLDAYRGIYILPTALREPNLSHPHNLVLEWWLFLGVLGVAALLWLLLSFFRQAWHMQRAAPPARAVLVQSAMAAMAAAVAHGMVDRFYFGAPDLAFIFFALLVVVGSDRKSAGAQGASGEQQSG